MVTGYNHVEIPLNIFKMYTIIYIHFKNIIDYFEVGRKIVKAL